MKKLFIVLAAMLTYTSTAFGQIGSLDRDLVYTPIPPCRIFDTRLSNFGPIVANGTGNFVVWGTTTYASQGGSATDCGITAGSNTAAVAINITVVTPTTGGYITAFPFGTTRPTAATVNFNAGDIKGNFSIAKNTQNDATLDLSIFSTSNVHLVGDVVGFYSKPVATSLDCYTTPEATISVAAGALGSASAVACAATYYSFPTGCYSDGTDFVAVPNSFACVLKNTGSTTQTMKYNRRCCRIPGR